MERRTTYTIHTQAPCNTQTNAQTNTQTVVVEHQQQPRVVHHVHHRRHYYGGGLLGSMARAVSEEVYGPHYHHDYVVTEYTQPAPVATTVHMTSSHHRPVATPPRQPVATHPCKPAATPPCRPTATPHHQTVPSSKAVDCFKLGNILELQSKLSGNRLMLDKDGALNCNGDSGPACQFKVRSSGRPGVYKLQNVAQSRCYLGYAKGYIIGHGKGDRECDFIVSSGQDYYITLECCQHLGNVLGSLPSGDITDPARTSKDSDVAQFAPHIITT